MLKHHSFENCIEAFKVNPPIEFNHSKLFGYLLSNFEITEEIQMEYFTICKTIRVNQASYWWSYVTEVKLPKWVHTGNVDYFLTALSALISFCFEQPCKVALDFNLDELSTDFLRKKVGIQYSVRSAGPFAELKSFANEEILSKSDDLKCLINSIYGIQNDSTLHNLCMQSLRLIQLSHLNFRTDFNLAFSLLVAGIETLSSKAISREDKNLFDKTISLSNVEILLSDFCEAHETDKKKLTGWFNTNVLEQAKLKARFIEFILKYSPTETWYELKEKYPKATSPPVGYEDILPKEIFTKEYQEKQRIELEKNYYPSDLTEDAIVKIIGNTYTYRSKFFHEGKSSPHEGDESKKFFEIAWDFTKVNTETNTLYGIICMKFELLSLIAKKSISKFIESKVDNN